MTEGVFREDLYFRLNVFRIEMPALSERREDIPDLAAAFLAQFGSELGRPGLRLTDAAAQALQACSWRGNVRELRNIMERVAVLAEGDEIGEPMIEHLAPTRAGSPEPTQGASQSLDLATVVSDAERKTILRALDAADDNKARAAALLGIGERTLWSKLKKHDL